MNIWTDRHRDRQIDRQTDEIHRYHVYVGLAQAVPMKKVKSSISMVPPTHALAHIHGLDIKG